MKYVRNMDFTLWKENRKMTMKNSGMNIKTDLLYGMNR